MARSNSTMDFYFVVIMFANNAGAHGMRILNLYGTGELILMGKNFSCNNTGKRRKSDFYETPFCLTRLLLDKIQLRGDIILEPACGNRAIVQVLFEYKYNTIFYDIETDFLKETKHYETIITNPPYSLAYEFIQQAKQCSNNFFFLLPLSYLHGKKRYDYVYQDKNFPLRKIFVFTRYPMLEDTKRKDGKHKTGMMVYAWYWFDKQYRKSATINWLDNNPFVVRKVL